MLVWAKNRICMDGQVCHALCFCYLSQREFDENEVDPYQGQQDKRPEPEAMDLPEELDLDQGDKDGEDNDDGDEGEGEGEACCLNYSFTNTVEKHACFIISDVLCDAQFWL